MDETASATPPADADAVRALSAKQIEELTFGAAKAMDGIGCDPGTNLYDQVSRAVEYVVAAIYASIPADAQRMYAHPPATEPKGLNELVGEIITRLHNYRHVHGGRYTLVDKADLTAAIDTLIDAAIAALSAEADAVRREENEACEEIAERWGRWAALSGSQDAIAVAAEIARHIRARLKQMTAHDAASPKPVSAGGGSLEGHIRAARRGGA